MPYESQSIANAFIELGIKDGKPLTNMKLQKLLYLAQGHALSLRGEELIGEDCQAWTYGPVFPGVYHWFKHLGSGEIKAPLIFPFGKAKESPWIPPSDKEVKEFLRMVWETYRDDSAIRLSELSHVEGGPWDKVYSGGAGRGKVIPKQSIERYFKEL